MDDQANCGFHVYLLLWLVAFTLFIFGFKDLFVKDDSFILDALALGAIIGVFL